MGVLYENRIHDLLLWYRSTLNFPPHFHDSAEIIYVLSGSVHAIIDGEEFTLNKDSLCLILPNVIHAYNGETNVSAYSLIIPRHFLSAYTSILDKNTVSTPVIHFQNSENELLKLIEKIFLTNKMPHPFRIQLLHGYFSVLFGELFARTGLSKAKKASPETERRILAYCTEKFRENVSLQRMADELHISKNHISYIFSSKLKMPLPDFLSSLRIAEAKRLIDDGCSITDAAYESGFQSLRTFNRRFLSEVGTSPRSYAKNAHTDT